MSNFLALGNFIAGGFEKALNGFVKDITKNQESIIVAISAIKQQLEA